MTLKEVASNISWGILFLVMGLYAMVQGVENAGLAGAVRQAVALAAPGDGFLQILRMAAGSALGSNLINNVPRTMVTIGALRSLIPGRTLGL